MCDYKMTNVESINAYDCVIPLNNIKYCKARTHENSLQTWFIYLVLISIYVELNY